MSIPAVRSTDVVDLRAHEELGAGGQGTVVLVESPGAFPGRLAFKEYSSECLADLDVGALEQLIAVPAEADDELRTLLEQHAAWPVATVHRNGAVCGFLMPAAPEEYVSYLRLAGTYQARLLAMEFLLNPAEYMANVDLPVSEQTRLALLRELARTVQILHHHGVVVGDLSPKNILIGLHPPRCYLLDCDAVRLRGRSAVPQIETPDWRVPEGEELATSASDRFKFGLLVIRVLQADQSVYDPEPVRARQPVLADLAARSQTAAPDERPTWDEWISALDVVIPDASRSVPTPDSGRSSRTAPPGSAPRSTAGPGTAVASRSGSRRGRPTALIAGAGVTVLICLLLGAIGSIGRDGGGVGDPPASATRAIGTETSAASAVKAATVGIVRVADANDDPAVMKVARMFDTYFRSINSRYWDVVLGLYDPAGVLDNTDPRQRRSFIDSMSTTSDDSATLLEVRSGAGPTATARLAFRSTQAPGYGPTGSPDETCTRWDITYELTSDGNDYRILRPLTFYHQPC